MSCHTLLRLAILFLATTATSVASAAALAADERIAWIWNAECRAAIRVDRARPTVQARTLFHVSAAAYDAWAAFDQHAQGLTYRDKVSVTDVASARRTAISHAAFTVLKARYGRSPGSVHTITAIEGRMKALGLDPYDTTTSGDSPVALGNRIGTLYIENGLVDGSREPRNYLEEPRFVPKNPALPSTIAGITVNDPDRWQPIIADGNTQRNVTPHWGRVVPFAFRPQDLKQVALPGPPRVAANQVKELREQVVEMIRLSSMLAASRSDEIDISPASLGANSLGRDDGKGRERNPATGRAYTPNRVRLGDYGRALADFWSDGPGTDTPPGHWNEIAEIISRDPRIVRRIFGEGAEVSLGEWDVKLQLLLNGVLHDAAIASWAIKTEFEASRPITLVRWMGSNGQSSDPGLPSFHEFGLPLIDGLIELITPESTAPGNHHSDLRGNEGKIAVLSWAGPRNPPRETSGVRWRLAIDWMPFQQWDFVTPAFPGYVSGHSTFSRAAAEALTALTGNEFFPGGLFEVVVAKQTGLRIEPGPSSTVRLQWATYRDAADSSGQSRRWGGIHIFADDFDGRRLGAAVAAAGIGHTRELFGR